MLRAQSNAEAMAKLIDVVQRQTLDNSEVLVEDTDLWHRLASGLAIAVLVQHLVLGMLNRTF